jgi:hypothetical protein
MRRVTIYTTDADYGHFLELAKNLQYVRKIETDEPKASVKLNIEAGLEEMRLFKNGSLKTKPAKDFLNEL